MPALSLIQDPECQQWRLGREVSLKQVTWPGELRHIVEMKYVYAQINRREYHGGGGGGDASHSSWQVHL